MNILAVVRSTVAACLVMTPIVFAAGVGTDPMTPKVGEGSNATAGAESRAAEVPAVDKSTKSVPLSSANATQGTKKTSRYRFVNLNRVLEGWSKAKKMQEEYAQEFERRNDALRARVSELEKKSQEMKSFQAGGKSEEFKKRAREIALAAAELKYDDEQVKKDKADQKLRILLSSYQQIQEVVSKWSSENDVDAVFVIQEEDAADTDLVGRYERALVRQVLWYSKDLDISDDVVKLLEVSSPAPQSRPANPQPSK